MKTLSKVEITKTFTIGDEEFKFKAKKINSLTVSKIAFKLGKTLGTGFAAAVDGRELGMTWTGLAEAIYENFTENQFEEIQTLIFQEVYHEKDGVWVRCTDDFWDECPLMLDITLWLIQENIVNFILSSAMFQRVVRPMEEKWGMSVKEKIESELTKLNIDIN